MDRGQADRVQTYRGQGNRKTERETRDRRKGPDRVHTAGVNADRVNLTL